MLKERSDRLESVLLPAAETCASRDIKHEKSKLTSKDFEETHPQPQPFYDMNPLATREHFPTPWPVQTSMHCLV